MDEHEFIGAFAALKSRAGGHSPSLTTLHAELGFTPAIDACYLGNPFATDVVSAVLREGLAEDGLARAMDRYPSPSRDLRHCLESLAGAPADRLVICNGVAEIIPYLLARYPGTTLLSVPTFSAYHEYAPGVVEEHETLETRQVLRAAEFLEHARRIRPATAVVINPNNPDGFTYDAPVLADLVAGLSDVCEQVVVDESFAGLVFPEPMPTSAPLVDLYDNVVVVRSLSKEYGVAGLRVGYAVMPPERAATAYEEGFLWNVNALAEMFLRALLHDGVRSQLESARHRYLRVCAEFVPTVSSLSRTPTASRANFALLRVPEGHSASVLAARAAFRHGVYTRSCEDKRGLSDEWLRVAARTPAENSVVLGALRDVLASEGGTPPRVVPLREGVVRS